MHIVDVIVSETALYDIHVKLSFYMKEAFLPHCDNLSRGSVVVLRILYTRTACFRCSVPANYDNLASVV